MGISTLIGLTYPFLLNNFRSLDNLKSCEQSPVLPAITTRGK
jgi:hypothetical protein